MLWTISAATLPTYCEASMIGNQNNRYLVLLPRATLSGFAAAATLDETVTDERKSARFCRQ